MKHASWNFYLWLFGTHLQDDSDTLREYRLEYLGVPEDLLLLLDDRQLRDDLLSLREQLEAFGDATPSTWQPSVISSLQRRHVKMFQSFKH